MNSTKTGSLDLLLNILKDNKVFIVERVYDDRLKISYIFKDIDDLSMYCMMRLMEGIRNGTTTNFVEFVFYPRKEKEKEEQA